MKEKELFEPAAGGREMMNSYRSGMGKGERKKRARWKEALASIFGIRRKKIQESMTVTQVGPLTLDTWMADWMKKPSIKLEDR